MAVVAVMMILQKCVKVCRAPKFRLRNRIVHKKPTTSRFIPAVVMEAAAFQCSMDLLLVTNMVQQMSADGNALRVQLDKQEKERVLALDGERIALNRIELTTRELTSVKEALTASERKLQEEIRSGKLLEVLNASETPADTRIDIGAFAKMAGESPPLRVSLSRYSSGNYSLHPGVGVLMGICSFDVSVAHDRRRWLKRASSWMRPLRTRTRG